MTETALKREKLRDRIEALQRTGKSYVDIALVLRREGLVSPRGNAIDNQYVYNQMYDRRRQTAMNAAKFRQAIVTNISRADVQPELTVKEQPRSTSIDLAISQIARDEQRALTELILDSQLKRDTKITLLRALL